MFYISPLLLNSVNNHFINMLLKNLTYLKLKFFLYFEVLFASCFWNEYTLKYFFIFPIIHNQFDYLIIPMFYIKKSKKLS